MLAAVANTSAGPLANILLKTDKSADLFANLRHPTIRTPSLPLIDDEENFDDEENVDDEPKVKCLQDYSPCFCFVNNTNEAMVSCNDVSVETVRDAFQRVNHPEIFALLWSSSADATNTISVPLDFLGNTSVTSVIHITTGNSNYPKLVIDPLALRSSQNSLAKFQVSNVDFGLQKDFNFLKGFDKLEELSISQIINFTASQYLPPSLKKLTVNQCSLDFNQIAFPAKLTELYLWENEIYDEKADEILTKLAASTSADSLEVLDLSKNSLTRIPSQVGSAFPKLKRLNLKKNKISNIPSASINFASPYLENLDLSENGIKTIASGAFVGKSFAA